MQALTHILSPLSAPWCGWTMLTLLLCFILSEVAQPGVISRVATIWQVKTNNRTYKSAPSNFFGQLLVSVFRICTPAMGICLCFYEGGDFRWVTYMAVCGLILGVMLLKMGCNLWVDFTFRLSRRYEEIYEQYGHLVTMSAIILYPCILVLFRLDNVLISRWVMGVVTALFLIWFAYRAVRAFYSSPGSIFYILLYFLTLEVLPLVAVWGISALMIFNL